MIPSFGTDGHLPPGRYRCTLEEVEESLVRSRVFSDPARREELFSGLIRYLTAWEDTQRNTGADAPLLRSVWMAGSFVSSKLSPSDIDVSPIVDGVIADSVAKRPGSRMIRNLTQDRASILRKYGVEVFPVRWFPIERPFQAGLDLAGDQLAYLSDRGKMDDWWQRCRIDGVDLPSIASCATRRGYLEVMVDESS
ncbi:DUF6932 family protein [Rhodococcus sp. IEGM 1318]|uniref:DUF6932 family protein n=1 Tax=Rhodococcus sp. IEGM 1318 TaxID=3082226 RepID=UPI0039896E4D